MDTEKKYNEALEKARMYRDNAKAVEDYAAVARYENIFPELHEEEKPLTPFQQCLNLLLHKVYYASVPGNVVKDVDKFILGIVKNHTDELVALAKKHEYTDCQLTEDERIRKWLVDYFGSIKETMWIHRDITCGQVLDWLKKQKEQHIPWYDYQKSKEAGYTIVPNEEYEQLIKQKEQKPAEWSEVELEFRGEKVKVKRPFYRDDKGRGYSTTKQDEEVAWNALRAWCEKKGISLYDLYPKAEWSEEDEKIRKEIINYLNFAESHNLLRAADYEKKKGWIDWLEKQKDAFENGRQLEWLMNLLKFHRQQLKKL